MRGEEKFSNPHSKGESLLRSKREGTAMRRVRVRRREGTATLRAKEREDRIQERAF